MKVGWTNEMNMGQREGNEGLRRGRNRVTNG
jgi:hypothetical protein